MMAGCSVRRFVPEEQTMLHKVKVETDNTAVSASSMRGFVRQHPNSKWFSLWRVPMLPYLMQSADTTRRFNRFLRRIGEAPVIYDPEQTQQTANAMQAAAKGLGFLNAVCRADTTISDGYKTTVTYRINAGKRYHIRQMKAEIADSGVAEALNGKRLTLDEGTPFDASLLDELRSDLTQRLHERGYYKLNRQHLAFVADTTVGDGQVDVLLRLLPFSDNQTGQHGTHPRYTVQRINYLTDVGFTQRHDKDVKHSISRSHDFFDRQRHTYRPRVLIHATDIEEGKPYSDNHTNATYAAMSRLGGVMTAGVHYEETSDSTLEAYVGLTTTRRQTISVEPEATNSAGDFGAAVVASYSNKNIFHGGEVLNLKARGAFEAIKGLSGYQDQNYVEWSGEASVSLPKFLIPLVRHKYQRQSQASTEIGVTYNSQDRPEFHRRVFSTAMRYRWYQYGRHMTHRLDLIDISYVFMPWISETFKHDYLDDTSSRNAILRYNYENLLIMKFGYQYSYTSRSTGNGTMLGRDAYAIRFAVESAGNMLDGLTKAANKPRNASGSREILGVAFAQYVKGDFDYSRSFRFDERNSLAVHGGLGIAYPYGNSTILPYEKRYFSGGANSVRGWSVRSLGPGSYKGTDGRIDFINQTGDLKLDLNAEFRTTLFWKIHTALFIDAGNIWTLRNYSDQPGGQFRFDTFWKQIAVAYGLGLRLNFDYFVLRLDGGMKAVNPAYTDSRHHFPIIHPRFGRDFQLHFAVGLPF